MTGTPSLGSTIDELTNIIARRSSADPNDSYTARLYQGELDDLLKKVGEEATEVVMAAKDLDSNHLRYEAVDLIYHLLVACERLGVSPEDLAIEIRGRF